MKTLWKIMIVCVLISFVAACGAKSAETPAGGTGETPLTAEEQWLKDNQLGSYFTLDQDWAAIEAAAKLEGKVVVYAGSSRIEDQIEIWNEIYPDITLEGYDTEGIATKVQEEHNAGNVVGDVVFDGDIMSLFGVLAPEGMVVPFIPSEFADALPTSEADPFAVQRYGGDAWQYNNEQNDSCPVTNWWQIVDGSYPNKVYYEDPLAEADKISLFVTVIKHGDDMAAAYKENSGSEWTTDPLYGEDTPNAGWLWVKKFAKSPNLVVMPGGDEIVEAMGSLGMTDPAGIANNSYSKVRDTIKGEAAIWPCEGLKPVVGTSGVTHLSIAANAPHPNAAKLFIRFALTEEGAAPWWTVLGDWPGRTDVSPAEGAPPVSTLWPDDGLMMFQMGSQVRDFWTLNALQ
jgi:iron(III) transport system substrate-binding protein